MVQLEGPIVQSIYDTAILSWWMSFKDPLPLLSKPPVYAPELSASDFVFGEEHQDVAGMGDREAMAERTRQRLVLIPSPSTPSPPTPRTPPALSLSVPSPLSPPALSPTTPLSPSAPSPIAPSPITPSPTSFTARGGDSPNGEGASGDAPTSLPPPPQTPQPSAAPFTPVLVHAPHEPFPIAMVNRTPRGRRGAGDAFVPQNQAWLAGFKFATRSVFLQTPSFSAKPIVFAALDAVRRGVTVEIYADLEFEDGEPSADGRANQLVAAYMYSQLAPEHRPNLRVYWYTAKGDSGPLSTRGSAHTCHIKLMSASPSLLLLFGFGRVGG